MLTDRPKLYLGLELNPDFAMISSCTETSGEPETISRINGSEQYQIPMTICKRRGIGQWFYGDDVSKAASKEDIVVVDNLYRRALAGEEIQVEDKVYQAEELLALFVRKVLMLPRRLGNQMEIAKLVVTVPELLPGSVGILKRVLKQNELRDEQVHLVDNRESFYYYALSQPEELYLHEVALFDLTEGILKFYALARNERTTPQTINITEKNYGMLYRDLDEMFTGVIEDAFAHRIVSTTYLTGDGFDSSWMKESLRVLCRGRKAFLGRNLYSKGACYAALVKGNVKPWNYVYMGENELKVNVSIKVRNEKEQSFLTLLTAGESWYDAEGTAEVILSGKPEIDFWLQEPRSREAKIQSVELLDFPEREDKTSRLRITAKPESDKTIRVIVKDLGFGEIVRASEKSWEYVIHE